MHISKYITPLLLGIAILLAACTPVQQSEPVATASPSPDPNVVGAYVDVINYQHDHNYGYELYDLTVPDMPAIGGGSVYPLASGGNVNCCIALPKVWRAGMKVMLAWRDYYRAEPDIDGVKLVDTKQEFEIPQYAEPGNLYLTFLPEGKVKLIVSQVEPGHPNWPGEIKSTPWEYCVEKNGRKACKAVLPHYGVGSWEEMQGFCTYLKEESPNEMNLCDQSIEACTQAYEDPERCKNVHWGARKK
jgi:Protein of unknown function (DUF3304)